MDYVTITDVNETNQYMEAGYFNTNLLPYANTGETPFGGNGGNELGIVTNESNSAVQLFDIEYVRFPAGQEKAAFSESGILEDGEIPQFLANFLDYALENGIGVNIVIPVEGLEAYGGQNQEEILTQLPVLVEKISEKYADVVKGFELGNEYWFGRTPGDESREVEYGMAAAKAALAINSGMQNGFDASIIIQASGNLAASYGNNLTEANQAIRDAFSSVADPADLIDGVVRNFYWRDGDTGAFDNDSGIFKEDRGIYENLHDESGTGWNDWAGTDLTTYVGEYNLTNRMSFAENELDLGVHGASMLLEHYTNMIEANVDYAFAWPILHNTRNAFLHRHEEIEVSTIGELEIVSNTTRAAMFDLLRQTVVGHELLDIDWDSNSGLELTAFKGHGREPVSDQNTAYDITIFFSSRSETSVLHAIDLSSLVNSFTGFSGISIFYGNEDDHQRDALLTEIELDFLGDITAFELLLQPYEVVQITFSLGYEVSPEGTMRFTESDDHYESNSTSGSYDLGEGDDTIIGGIGSDTIIGGTGDDLIFSGNGDDVINGDGSSDTIFGEAGNDHIRGGWGRDSINGGEGNDSIFAGSMNDTVDAGAGNDWITGDAGKDQLYGGSGHDLIDGGDDADRMYGGAGVDTLYGGSDSDLLHGEAGDDLVWGGEGDDALLGGNGNDRLFGEIGEDTIIGGRGDDLVRAGSNSDVVKAGSGSDTIFGGGGFDFLDGGEGNDWISGGFNADRFIFGENHGDDTISDFEYQNPAEKIVIFSGDVPLDFSMLLDGAVDLESGVVLDTGIGGSIHLLGVFAADLDPSDFAFF
ncbi:calcium-binding protein [Hasllibacter sp. MH4015]|uniref:calcium-binding protein n=1 Tax=Hasllibacter sp. MH4015 TaxID=2854029 RepID=UPI001CD75691|nr:calcium-binding protein [Hasllibacter sp. MH4015]